MAVFCVNSLLIRLSILCYMNYNLSMKKAQLLLALSAMIIPAFLSSCKSASASSQYPLYEGTDQPLTYKTTEAFISTYDNGSNFNPVGIEVYFKDAKLTSDQYFFVSVAANPENSKITTEATFSSSKPTEEVSFYAAYHDDTTMYVTSAITVTVKNSQAASPWLVYTVTGIALVGLALVTTLGMRAKQKKSQENTEEGNK